MSDESRIEATEPEAEPKRRWSWIRPLTIVVAIFAVVVVYAFGFEQTDVDLEPLKSETRRESLVRIMRGLASPDIIEYDEIETFVFLPLTIPCPDGYAAPEPDTSGAYLVMTPPCADPGADVVVEGFGFPPGIKAPLSFIPNTEQSPIPLRPIEVQIGDDGTFSAEFELPDRPVESTPNPALRMTTIERSGGPKFTDAARVTWDKIIETVMLALMATTLGIAVAIPLSFFSARNLMRSIRSPLLSVSLFIIALPIGVFIGTMFGRLITRTGDDWYTNAGDGWAREPLLICSIALVATMAAAYALFRSTVREEDEGIPTGAEKAMRGLVWAALGALAIYALLVLGYLLMDVGRRLDGDLGMFDFVARFLTTFGDLITTFMRALTALAVGLVAAFLGSRLGQRLVDTLPRSAAVPLRYPAAALAVGFLAAGIGWIVDWLYEYQLDNQAIPATAGALLLAVVGGGIVTRLARQWTANLGGLGGLLRFFLGLAGILAAGVLGALLGSSADRIVGSFMDDGSLLAAGLVGALYGLGAAHATRRLDALPTGLATYYLSRSFFNAIRSVEPLVMAIVFVVWVSTGPFAGSLALALHTIAALAKLYSEQVESIMTGPIEAVTATGATRLQNVVYAVVPQIVPPYIAFTLYRWDINVRMSTIIGFAGGGGIGFVLQQNINLGKYGAASMQMLAIAVVVAALDFASARVRERIV